MTKDPKPGKPSKPSKPSAAPGTKDGKGGKRVERVLYPVPEGGLEDWPKDFVPKKHKPLKRKDFKDETVWLLERAKDYEKRAVRLRKEAADWKRLGSVKDRAKAKKLLTMQSRMAELMAQLKDQGIDVDALMKKDEDEVTEVPGASAAPAQQTL